MQSKKKRTAIALVVVAIFMFITGCSVVNTGPDMLALHYSGGTFSSTHFESCVDPGSRQTNGPGEHYYYYPTSQRTYDATALDESDRVAKQADAIRFKSVSKDNAEMYTGVVIQFDLTTDCELLRKFHETLANRYHAYWDSGDNSDEIPEGWEHLLNIVIGKPLDITLDRVEQQYAWRDLYNKPEARVALQTAVENELPELSEVQQGGNEFFTNWAVLVQKPEPVNQELKDAIAAQQAGVAKAQAAQAAARAEKLQAQAEIAVARAQAQKRLQEIKGYGGVKNYLMALCIDAGCNPYQPSYGSPVGTTNP